MFSAQSAPTVADEGGGTAGAWTSQSADQEPPSRMPPPLQETPWTDQAPLEAMPTKPPPPPPRTEPPPKAESMVNGAPYLGDVTTTAGPPTRLPPQPPLDPAATPSRAMPSQAELDPFAAPTPPTVQTHTAPEIPPAFADPPTDPFARAGAQPLEAAFGDVVEPTVTSGEDSVYNAKNHVGSVSMWKKGFRQGIKPSKSAGAAPQGGMALPGMHDDVMGEEIFNMPKADPPKVPRAAGFEAFSLPAASAPRPPPPAQTAPRQPPPASTAARPRPPPPAATAPRASMSALPRAPQQPPQPRAPIPAKKVDFGDKDYGLVDFDNMMISQRPRLPAHPSTTEPVKTLNELAKIQAAKPGVGPPTTPQPNDRPQPQAAPTAYYQQPVGQQYLIQHPGMAPQVILVPPGAYPPPGAVPYGPPPAVLPTGYQYAAVPGQPQVQPRL